ncbi:MAG: YicC family protein [Cyclobacteriaceae bacterium]|nr:YicC family protein [Cyclobacteriaceae bacterium]
MVKSMTGFGTVSSTVGSYTIIVEVKSLNSKFSDVTLRTPSQLSSKEIELRKNITDMLTRGKISVVVDVTSDSPEENLIDKDQFQKYYKVYKGIAESVNADAGELLKLAIQAPGVIASPNNQELPEGVLEAIPGIIEEALLECDKFRQQEGDELESKLRDYINAISHNLEKVEKLDAGRAGRVAERLKASLAGLNLDVEVDKNRFEQELIYYIEKFDINEEKVRLANHLNYFREILDATEPVGKKLGFVSQEIGREINTIGSKANDSDIQKHVVAMKEELEKIKEQSLNIL